jgi:hypothetical protein
LDDIQLPQVAATEAAMLEEPKVVLSGFPLRTDAKIAR